MMWFFDINMASGYFLGLWIIAAVVGAHQDVCYDEKNDNLVTYSRDESLCCDGKVINHQDHLFDCYKSRIFDRSKRRICGTELYKTRNGRYACFQNSEVYDTSEKMVCGGVLNERREGLECCSNHTMNVSTEVCCPVDGQYLSLTPEACCRQRTPESYTDGLTCCGDVPYHGTTHLCCDETLIPANGTNECIPDSAAVYNTLTHVQVGDRVEAIVDGKYQDCDDQLFNPSHQMCHYQEFEIIEIGSASYGFCEGYPYSRETSSCCKGNASIHHGIPEIPDVTRCGSEKYEPYLVTDTLDCEGALYLRSSDGLIQCCGAETFNVTEKLCCRGVIVDKPSTTTSCCQASGYETLTHTCLSEGLVEFKIVQGVYSKEQICGAEILGENDFCVEDGMLISHKIRGSRGDNAICRMTPYNNEKFICSPRQALFPRIPGRAVCFRSDREVLYKTSDEICCINELYQKNTECGQRECCGAKPFTPEYQSCSPSNNVVEIPANVSETCGSDVYDNRTEDCDHANGLVVDKMVLRRNPSICWVDGRPKRYNDRSQTCCNNKLFSTEGMQAPDCCGDTPYDSASADRICCDHVLHETFGAPMSCDGRIAYTEEQRVCQGVLYNKTDGECCSSGVYNPRTELCCDNRVKLTKSTETEECCGPAKYDTLDSSKICCGGKTLHTYADSLECCGTSLVNPQFQICLNDEFAISREFESSTCDPSLELHADGTCCGGLLYVGQFGGCEGLRFVPNEENPLWCGQRLRAEGEECCGGSTIYSTSDHTCQDGRVIPLCAGEGYDPVTQSCCSDKIIDNSEKICCSGRVRLIGDGENSCCGRVAYNNETSICCRKTVKRLDDLTTTDLNNCCPRDQVFSLSQDRCLDEHPQVCSVLSQNRRSKKLVREAACGSSLHAMVSVTRTSSTSREISVKTRALSEPCPYCAPSSSGNQILRGIHTIILPEVCAGASLLALNQQFLVVDSSIPDAEGGRLQLTENARIFRRGAATVVRKTYQDGCS